MSRSSRSLIPSQQPGYGWSMYDHHIFAALVRAAEQYRLLWVDMEQRCKTPLDLKLAAGSDEIEEAAIPVILLAHAMVEALANWYLAMSCSKKDFKTCGSQSLIEKWRSVPRQWLSKYALPENHELCRDLQTLIARRKRITHHKPFVEADEQVIHAGDQKKMATADLAFVKRIASLPLRLIEHLKQFDSAQFLHFCTITLEQKQACVLQRMRRERRTA